MRQQVRTILVGLGLLCSAGAPAQVLARPGWAGSGVSPEAWWPRAVFYRLDPARFQDSDGDGRGDLAGVVQRLDYLQSLGMDALLLDSLPESRDPDALGDLVREASRHQLRVLLTVSPETMAGPRGALLNTVHGWLGAGVAGVWLPKPQAPALTEASYATLVGAVRSMVGTFPGERVLLTDPAPLTLSLAPRRVRLGRHADPHSFTAPGGGQLVTSAIFPVGTPSTSPLRASLGAAAEDGSPGLFGMLRFAHPPANSSPDVAADAATLLGSRGAVILDFGDELGLDMYPAVAKTEAAALPNMQWTPSNRTPAKAEPSDAAGAAGASTPETQFGEFHPYVRPPRGIIATTSGVHVTQDMNVAESLPDPDTLSGFTTGPLPSPPVAGGERNAITEDRDPKSLLNQYRQLIALHHDNATIRNGSQAVMNYDTENTLVWIRRAPAGSRTVANVLAAANLSDRPVTLSVDSELEKAGMRPGALRPLFSSAASATTGESTEHLVLPPHAAYIGEIYHGGAVGPAPEAEGKSSSHRRRHHH